MLIIEIPIIIVDIITFIEKVIISFSNFIFSRINKLIKIIIFTHAATEVEIAKPTCLNSSIRSKFKIRFILIENKDTFIGVIVSSLAKKESPKSLSL